MTSTCFALGRLTCPGISALLLLRKGMMVLKLAVSSGPSMRMTLTCCAGAELKMLLTPLLMKVNLREKVVLLSVGRSQWIKTVPLTATVLYHKGHVWLRYLCLQEKGEQSSMYSYVSFIIMSLSYSHHILTHIPVMLWNIYLKIF